MNKKTYYLILIKLIIGTLLLFSFSCSKNLTNGYASNNDELLPINKETKYTNNTIVKLDQKLADINNEKTAKEAILYFSNHVNNNKEDRTYQVKTPQQINSLGNKKTGLSNENLSKLIAIELDTRHNNKSTKDSILFHKTNAPQQLITIEKLTTIINSLEIIANETTPPFTENQIRQNQQLIRQTLPHLSTTNNELMTPFEASIIMYYIMTGDNGSNDTSIMKLTADNDDIQTFIDLLTKN